MRVSGPCRADVWMCPPPSTHVSRPPQPANVGLDAHDRVTLLGFGRAHVWRLSARVDSTERRTLTAFTGTERYMAPEVAAGHSYNHKCDVYSWALVLWRMLSQEAPNDDDASAQIGPPRPTELRALLEAAWHADPSARPEMNAIWHRLRALLSPPTDGTVGHVRGLPADRFCEPTCGPPGGLPSSPPSSPPSRPDSACSTRSARSPPGSPLSPFGTTAAVGAPDAKDAASPLPKPAPTVPLAMAANVPTKVSTTSVATRVATSVPIGVPTSVPTSVVTSVPTSVPTSVAAHWAHPGGALVVAPAAHRPRARQLVAMSLLEAAVAGGLGDVSSPTEWL